VKILVVDDSKAMRAIVKRALSTLDRVAGATIIEAADGREAFASVQAESPDLVLSDWNMPEMTGIELLKALNDAGACPPTFGFVTSESTPEMHELAKVNGARFLVSKPFTAESLDRALSGAL
jgi:two-component system, chemotaxis family, chemotaxis protein CheY